MRAQKQKADEQKASSGLAHAERSRVQAQLESPLRDLRFNGRVAWRGSSLKKRFEGRRARGVVGQGFGAALGVRAPSLHAHAALRRPTCCRQEPLHTLVSRSGACDERHARCNGNGVRGAPAPRPPPPRAGAPKNGKAKGETGETLYSHQSFYSCCLFGLFFLWPRRRGNKKGGGGCGCRRSRLPQQVGARAHTHTHWFCVADRMSSEPCADLQNDTLSHLTHTQEPEGGEGGAESVA